MPLKVAHMITQLELGGAQRNTLYTVAHLDRERFDPVLVSGPGGILDDEARSQPIASEFVSCLQRDIHPVLDIVAFVQLYRWLRRERPHIVHTHSSKAGLLGRLAAYLAGVPVIVHTFHGFGFTPGQNKRVRNWFVKLERWGAHLARHLIFVSEDNRQEAERERIHGGATTSIIRSGIQIEEDGVSTVRQELGIPSEAWVIASIGNFKPQKNPLELVKVACEVVAGDPAIHVLLAGDGELRPQAEALVQSAGPADRIHFLGWRKDARALLRASNAFVLTSLWEGLPRALVEAFASGLPAVAYAVNGVNDILVDEGNGFSIAPHDTALAVEKLLWLKNHPQDARRMGAAGRARIETEFDIDRMVREQESLYDKLWAAVPLKEYYGWDLSARPPIPESKQLQ